MIDIITTFKQYGIDNNYFEIKPIKNFNNAINEGINHINIQAIEFDKTKDRVCSEFHQHCLMSCDALDILDSKNKINFIEFKGLNNEEDTREFIKGLKLPKKFKDSRDVLLLILRKNNFIYRDKIEHYNNIEKNIIIAFDLNINSRLKIAFSIKFLAIHSLIKKQFVDNMIEGENYNEPVCIKKSNFNTLYLKYI